MEALKKGWGALCCAVVVALPASLAAQPFLLPTANRAIYEPGGEERYFVGTSGKSWETGTFGGVRSEGRQFHEGIDIRALQRDRHGEPTDPVMATADGVVAYINRKPALSNYGNYIVLRHHIDGLEVYSLYAHLHEARRDLREGQAVKAGEVIAVMGRTANTHEGISKDRAHVHFEIDLFVNDRFAEWYRRHQPGQRNDHGNWNGRNLMGLDPRLILLEEQREGPRFSLAAFIRNETELCRVQVRETNFPWIRRYPGLVVKNPVAEKEGVAGYELVLNYTGVPVQAIPRAASELKGKGRVELISVNAAEEQKNPCCKLVSQRRGHWALTNNGESLISLLTF
jgi:murein DD-endopeptidase MepM/ murein hydrolase activator NlpD